jgi:hypothetical protein
MEREQADERFTLEEAAKYLGVSPKGLFNIRRLKKIRVIGVGSKGGRVYITRQACDQYLRDNEQGD